MLEEKDLIPYELSEIPPGPWLIFAPHPDDDVFGMGGTIALASKKKIRVEVVVMTKGEIAGDPEIRKKESLQAGEILGVSLYHFWSIPDRGISQSGIIVKELETLLDSVKPKTVFLPGIQEFHPDHRATTQLIWSLLNDCGFSQNVWLYEISRQNEANRLVDISSVVETKRRAMKCFFSQLSQLDYERVVLAINTGRSYTLPVEVTHAEAFWCCESVQNQDPLMSQYGALYRYRVNISKTDSPLVSVIVRTKNRIDLLQEAIDSIALQTHRPVEIIVVNDGGIAVPIDHIRKTIPDIFLKYIEHQTNQGRAASANSGIAQATGEFICFLDDDDIFYPSALESLLLHANEKCVTHARAKCVTYGSNGVADPENVVFLGEPINRGKLILENYIAFNTICIPKKILKQIGPLDESLEIYEDWDLLIRLSRTYEMVFIDALVSEYRIFGSATFTGKGGADKQYFFRKKVLAKHLNDVSAEDILKLVQRSVDKVVLEKEKKIHLLEGDIKQIQMEHDHLQAIVTDRESIIHNLQHTLKTKDQEILNLYDNINHQQHTLKTKDQEILNLHDNISVLKGTISGLETQLSEVFCSTSWKITSPIRKLKNLTRF